MKIDTAYKMTLAHQMHGNKVVYIVPPFALCTPTSNIQFSSA